MSSTVYCCEKKTWQGPSKPAPLFNDKANLGRIILSVINRDPQKVAQISDNNGIRMTNREIASDAEKIAAGLKQRGCKTGDVVGFVARNGHNLTPTLIACFLLEAPVNAMDVKQNEDELYAIFKITKPKFIFCDDDKVPAVAKVIQRLDLSSSSIIVYGTKVPDHVHIENLMKEGDSDEIKRKIYDESCGENKMKYQIIVCSSGTTGPPKAVAITYQSLLDPHWSKKISSTPTDCYFSFCSLFWSVYYIILYSNLILGITRVITTEPLSPELFIHIAKKYKITHTLTSPIYISNILDSPALTSSSLLSMKHIWTGGNIFKEELANKFLTYTPNGDLQIAYGMTETGTIATYVYDPKRTICVGNLLPGIEGIVIDDEGKRLGPNETGQVCFRVPYPMVEYIDNPVATKKYFDTDGFAYTGDLGYFDKEGFLYITGRCKDVIKYLMNHVSGSEIERVIKSLPGVSEVAAVGISDPKFYQLPAVVVVKQKDSSLSAEDIERTVAEKLPDTHKLRGGVYFVDSLSKTLSGKMRKNEARIYAEEMFNNKNNPVN